MAFKRTILSLLFLGAILGGCRAPELYNAADPGSDDFQLLSLARCAIGEADSLCYIGLSPITPVYPNHSAWNEYIKNDGLTVLTGTGTSCTGAETNRRECVHAGIMRRVSTTRNSCAGLTATDSLDALEWHCRDDSGLAEFTAAGFRPGKKLSDLLDASTIAWRFMSVTVTDGFSSAVTPAVQPWSNPVVVDNDGIGAGQTSAGSVYLVTANPAFATNILDVDKVAYVIMPGVALTGTGAGGEVVVRVQSANFIWLEGEIDLTGDTAAFEITGNFIEGRGIRTYNGSGPAFPLIGGGNMRFSDIYLANMSNGILLSTPHIRISEFYANNVGTALNFVTANNMVMNAVIAASNGSPISFNTSDQVLINTTIAGVTTNGIQNSGGSFSLVVNLASVNAGTASVIQNGVSNLSYLNLAPAHSGVNGYDLVGGANFNTFSGYFITGNNGTSDCDITGGPSNPGITANCAPADGSDHILQRDADLRNSFVGKIAAEDTVNSSDSAGSAITSAITDWTRFENDYRLWAPDASGIADPVLRALCGGTCAIYDWSLSASDTVLRNRLPEPRGDITFSHTFSAGTSDSFLRYATELMDDGYGDDDGLCEAVERCLYTPNIGAYQGHGELNALGNITSGTIKDIILYQYATNGR